MRSHDFTCEFGTVSCGVFVREEKEQLTELLRAATTDQLFQFNGVIYEQKDGVAMGSPLGPLLANVFMRSLEEKLYDKEAMPEFYKRFVHDSCSLMPGTVPGVAAGFFVTLNWLQPSIRFIMEIAVDGKLPFLGMLIRKSDTVLTTEVYFTESQRILVCYCISTATLTVGIKMVLPEL